MTLTARKRTIEPQGGGTSLRPAKPIPWRLRVASLTNWLNFEVPPATRDFGELWPLCTTPPAFIQVKFEPGLSLTSGV
jgi:hypothetical protein